jgi:branched-chain amino acid transport system ATP-binding protein
MRGFGGFRRATFPRLAGPLNGPDRRPPGICISGLNSGYGRIGVLRGIDLVIQPGAQGVAVLGANGVGKTTLLRSIVQGFGVRSAGEICIDGRNVIGERPENIRRLGVALVPDDRRIFPLSVRDNLVLSHFGGGEAADRIEEVTEIFPFLRARMNQRADTLSGGQRQALAICRALMVPPKYLLLDEPAEGLAPAAVDSLLSGMTKIRDSSSITLVIVERNARILTELCADAVALRRGSVVWRGAIEDYLADPEIVDQG